MLILLAVTGIGAASCSGGEKRSTEAFCATMRSEKERILAQFNANSGDGQVDSLEEALAGFAVSAQALGELRTYFKKLARVAPDEIRTEMEIVANAYDEQLDAAGEAAVDPLGGLASAFVTSLTTSGQLTAVDNFARENCGESI